MNFKFEKRRNQWQAVQLCFKTRNFHTFNVNFSTD